MSSFRPITRRIPWIPPGRHPTAPRFFPTMARPSTWRAQAMLNTPKVIETAIADYNKIFGRNYSPFLEEYKTKDADFVFFLQGAHARTARYAVDHLRKKGVKAGMVKLRFLRPFPTEKVAETLSKF